MVAPKDDNGVLGQLESIKSGEQLAHLGVGVTDAGVIATDEIASHVVGYRASPGHPMIGP